MNEVRPPIALFAGSEMGERIAAYDWRGSSLGPIDGWPVELVNAVALLLPAAAEIVLFWGEDYIAFYNDAYAPTIGNKHPAALGRPAREAWRELWDDLKPLLDHVRTTGETYAAKDRPFYIERAGYGEEVFFDISYSAVPLHDGGIGGVLCIVSETTERVRAARGVARAWPRCSTPRPASWRCCASRVTGSSSPTPPIGGCSAGARLSGGRWRRRCRKRRSRASSTCSTRW
jgi:hypothetical protein